MPEKQQEPEQTEQTPKGLTVPVPKRETFFGNLKKVARPDAPKQPPAPRAHRMPNPRGRPSKGK
jgi:hypothetical protein